MITFILEYHAIFFLQKTQSTSDLATSVVLSKPSSVLSDPSSETGSGQFQPNQNWFGKKQTNLLQYPNHYNSKTRLDKLLIFSLKVLLSRETLENSGIERRLFYDFI